MKKFYVIFFIMTSLILKSQIGIIDPSFNVGSGSNNYVYHILIDSNKKVLASGNFTSFNNIPRKFLVRLNIDGSVDTSFIPEINASKNITKSVLQSDGKIVVIGTNNNDSHYISRLNSNGSIDGTFISPISTLNVYSDILIDANDKILISGAIFNIDGSLLKNVVRLNIDGTVDSTFNPGNSGAIGIVTAAKLLSNNKIIIGGYFSKYNNVNRKGIARLNEDGTLDETFNPGLGANSAIYGIDEVENGKILIGGFFTDYDGIPRNTIARINQDGTLDLTFQATGGNGVSYIKKQTNGKILVSGGFTTFNGVAKNYITSLNNDGSLENNTIDTNFDNAVNICDKQQDGKLICGGYFSNYGGISSKGVVRITPNDLLSTATSSEIKIQITPNPTKDFIHIKTTKLDIEKVFIFDLSGKLIMTETSKDINISHLPTGNYVLSIKTYDGIKSFKIIKL